MYYLKYRPRTINQLDNSTAREILSKILHQNSNLPHAYLFVGQKGTGKTSSARIFAKAVNCSENIFSGKSKEYEPCNHCDNCNRIDGATSADVTELDAASNRGIEEIKNIIKEAGFAPMTGHYRVFIIDEAHMITNEAFNALLKTLEEPPPSVIFILATTNEEKVPKTIQSRCFKVVFGKAKKNDVLQQLHRIVKEENLLVDEKLLDLVASHSDNSFRDAAKLLEELVIQNKLTLDDAQNYVGVRTKLNLLTILESKSLKDTIKWIDDFATTGGSFKNLIEELLAELHDQLLIKNGITTEEKKVYNLSIKEIALLMKLFNEAYSLLKFSPIESLPLEIAVVEFYNKGKLT